MMCVFFTDESDPQRLGQGLTNFLFCEGPGAGYFKYGALCGLGCNHSPHESAEHTTHHWLCFSQSLQVLTFEFHTLFR